MLDEKQKKCYNLEIKRFMSNLDTKAKDSGENESSETKDWKKAYEERRNLIAQTDEETIRIGLSKSEEFGDSTNQYVLMALDDEDNKEYFHQALRGKPLINIGSGGGFYSAFKMAGCTIDDQDEPQVPDYGISDQVLVDPYYEEDEMKKRLERERAQFISEKDRARVKDKIHFVKNDGLSFLLDQTDESGNVITSSIDHFLIRYEPYLRRMAQEICRVTPTDGVFICVNSPDIEAESKKLFPYWVRTDVATLFSKSPFTGMLEFTRTQFKGLFGG